MARGLLECDFQKGERRMSRRRKSKKIVIHGVVTPEEWGDGDGLTHISIITDDYEKYDIIGDEIGEELIDYRYESVRVYGVVELGRTGNKLLKVVDFTPDEETSEDAWDDGP